MKKPKLGQRIKASDRLIRHVSHDDIKTWTRFGECWGWTKPKPVTGIYIGSRTYQNGVLHYENDVGFTFEPTEHIQVWLIVENDRQCPVPVLPEDVKQ